MSNSTDTPVGRQAAALKRLHDIAEAEIALQQEREKVIAEARNIGTRWDDICAFARLSRPTAIKYAERARQAVAA